MEYRSVADAGYEVFHSLLNAYYRDGEDADTPQPQIDAFIRYLYDLCLKGEISGAVALEKDPVGFVLWNVDSETGVFSQKPGCGTILEIGVTQMHRGMGLGRKLVCCAEEQMKADRYYVCAYGPAEAFWSKCGYVFAGEFAENGLKIMVKGDDNGR